MKKLTADLNLFKQSMIDQLVDENHGTEKNTQEKSRATDACIVKQPQLAAKEMGNELLACQMPATHNQAGIVQTPVPDKKERRNLGTSEVSMRWDKSQLRRRFAGKLKMRGPRSAVLALIAPSNIGLSHSASLTDE
ncbi:hypothetical protein PABG_11742 [Paracoccidioides brasiliensis Pb03]|nr:hypothetical protein PABG_11742 [Paracoccidioides brasiliensis Pb03]